MNEWPELELKFLQLSVYIILDYYMITIDNSLHVSFLSLSLSIYIYTHCSRNTPLITILLIHIYITRNHKLICLRPRTHGNVFLRFCIVSSNELVVLDSLENSKQYKNAGKRFRVYGPN